MKCCYIDAKETKSFSSLAPNNQVPFYVCGCLLRVRSVERSQCRAWRVNMMALCLPFFVVFLTTCKDNISLRWYFIS